MVKGEIVGFVTNQATKRGSAGTKREAKQTKQEGKEPKRKVEGKP